MPLHPGTLLLVTALIAATVGVLLIFAWWQNRSHRALALWGGADLAAALGTSLLMLRGEVPEALSVVLAHAMLAGAHGAIWGAARVFCGRPLPRLWMAMGPLAWLAACTVPAFLESTDLRLVLISLINAAYSFAAAYELWRHCREPLLSRYPAAACLAVHAVLVLARIGLALFWTLPPAPDVLKLSWLGAIAIEPALLVIVAGFLQLSMTKERSEAVQRLAAATDDLTRVASRRAFFDEGERRLRAARRLGQPSALLLFDLDHFKQINDRYGHPVGDKVLRAFAARAATSLPERGLFGRIGGEEFAVLLPDTDLDPALWTAENIRRTVEIMAFDDQDMPRTLSVSVGVAIGRGPACDFAGMLTRADRALYAAKSGGRNRVHFDGARFTPSQQAV